MLAQALSALGGARCLALRAGLAGALLAAAPAAAQQDMNPRVPRLDGVWVGWVVDGAGEEPDRGHLKLLLRVEGGKMAAQEVQGRTPGEGLGAGTFQAVQVGDEGLGAIDALRTSNPGKGQTYEGIFRLDGDTLWWCTAVPGQDRPKEFETKRGQYLLILRRQEAPRR